MLLDNNYIDKYTIEGFPLWKNSLDHNICMKYACIGNNIKLITYFLENKLILPTLQHVLFSCNTAVYIETLRIFYKYGLCFDKKLMYLLNNIIHI